MVCPEVVLLCQVDVTVAFLPSKQVERVRFPYLVRRIYLLLEERKIVTRRQRVGVFLAALLVSLGTGAVAATPAQAFLSDCPSGYFCMWTNYWYNGLPYLYWIPPGTGGFCSNFNSTLNDNVDSAALPNGTYSRSVTMYKDANCSGGPVAFFGTPEFGGPYYGSCTDSGVDNWACNWSLPGSLPSSVWTIRR
jgi:hypothetical protein